VTGGKVDNYGDGATGDDHDNDDGNGTTDDDVDDCALRGGGRVRG